jgi:hypothetical protein
MAFVQRTVAWLDETWRAAAVIAKDAEVLTESANRLPSA